MPRKYKKRSTRRVFRKKARGRRTTLKKTIQRVINKNTETKYFDVSGENLQLYHNVGQSAGIPLITTPYSDTTFFNPWADIPPGTGRANRIGDRIKPLSMSISIWLANKDDRPNIMYRIMVLRMPKAIGGVITTKDNVFPFQLSQLGATGNTMILPLDRDRGIKPYYDRVHNLQVGFSYANGVNQNKECHKLVRISLRRKQSREIVYDSAAQNIVNSPLLLYVIPYDSWGTLITDRIASYSYSMRMRYKDS